MITRTPQKISQIFGSGRPGSTRIDPWYGRYGCIICLLSTNTNHHDDDREEDLACDSFVANFSNTVFGEPRVRRVSDPNNVDVTTASSSSVLATRNTAAINIGFGKSHSVLRGITDLTPPPNDHVATAGAIATRNA